MAAAAAGGAGRRATRVAAGGGGHSTLLAEGEGERHVCRVGVVLLCVWSVQGGGRWEGGQACGVVAFQIPKPRNTNELDNFNNCKFLKLNCCTHYVSKQSVSNTLTLGTVGP